MMDGNCRKKSTNLDMVDMVYCKWESVVDERREENRPKIIGTVCETEWLWL
jgi:hypothetical protein